MRGLLQSSSGITLILLGAGACSQVLGISDYEIDPTLDETTRSVGGARYTDAGAPTVEGGEAGTSAGGAEAGSGGSKPAAGNGGQSTAGTMASGGGQAGDGSVPSGCQSAVDCDDDIDCTIDVCQPSGTCQHTADDSACDASKCQTCQGGVGCVAGPTETQELLTDPGFDGTNEDWIETSDTFNDRNIFANAMAQTAPNAAKFGPAANDADTQEYADLLQYVIIPERTVSINLSGYYKLTPGAVFPDEDYVVAAFYEAGASEPTSQFHEWPGDGTPRAAWTSFSYNAAKSDVAEMRGNEYSFDLVAYSWESVFYFDSLKLTATVCQ